ncbi:hypothetical protein AB0G02_31125 [Actinosynnema sp. NPDC023658]|uniref:hypothetical protein n=1 Tax=Actinosynnema sp. NPDC023658 TaxID=3155465 RepID=UPI0034005079
MTNPFATTEGVQAQRNLFRVLASADDGALADFAKDVVAGRVAPRDLLTRSWAVESVADETLAAIDEFQRLPETERAALVARGPEFLDEYVAGLASLDVEAEPTPPPPPRRRPARDEDDDEPPPSLLRDAW